MAFVQSTDTREEKRRARYEAMMDAGLQNMISGYGKIEESQAKKAEGKRKDAIELLGTWSKLAKDTDKDIEFGKFAKEFDPETQKRALDEERKEKKKALSDLRRKAIDEVDEKYKKEGFDADEDYDEHSSVFTPIKKFFGKEISKKEADAYLWKADIDEAARPYEEEMDRIDDEYDKKIKNAGYDMTGVGQLIKDAAYRPEKNPKKAEILAVDLANKQETLIKKRRENSPDYIPPTTAQKNYGKKAMIDERLEKAKRENSEPYLPDTREGRFEKKKELIALYAKNKTEEEARQMENFDRKEKFKSGIDLDEKITVKISNIKEAQALLGVIEEDSRKIKDLGFFKEPKEAIARIFNSTDRKYTTFRANLLQNLSEVILLISGAASSDGEVTRIRAFEPNSTDTGEMIADKILGLKKFAITKMKILNSQYSPANKEKQQAGQKIIDDGSKFIKDKEYHRDTPLEDKNKDYNKARKEQLYLKAKEEIERKKAKEGKGI